MRKREFTYEGFDGKQHTDTWYFYLSKADLMGYIGLQDAIQKMVDAKDGKEIMDSLKEVILRSVGKPSADGRRFIRDEETANEFSQTPAFDELFVEIATDPDKALDFISSIVPKELSQKMMEDRKKIAEETNILVSAAE